MGMRMEFRDRPLLRPTGFKLHSAEPQKDLEIVLYRLVFIKLSDK